MSLFMSKLSNEKFDIGNRINFLKHMREKLCEKEKAWETAYETNDWLIEQIKILIDMIKNPETKIEDFIERLEDVLCAVDTGEEDE